MKKSSIKMIIALSLMVLGLVFAFGVHAKADEVVNISGTRLINLTGDGWFINRADYYHLDTEELSWKENGYSFMDGISNGLFTGICWIGRLVIVGYYHIMNFDIVALFQNEISGIQTTMNNGIFLPLYTLACCGASIHILGRLVKRDMMGAYGQIAKVVAIFVLSVFLVRDSATVLSGVTDLTKAVSVQILSGMNSGRGGSPQEMVSSAAAESSGILWANMVHKPWLYLEFGDEEANVSSSFVHTLFYQHNEAETENRAAIVADYAGNAFSKARIWQRVVFEILYIPVLLVKGALYLIMAIFLLGYQLIAIFYVLLTPIILLLAMMPGYEEIITAWLKKIFESQLGILILSYLLGFIIKIDDLMFQKCSVAWGWLMVPIFQAIIELIIFFKRNEILGMIGKLQKAGSTSGYARAMLRNANSNAATATRDAAVSTARAGVKAAHWTGRKINSARNYISETRHYITGRYNDRQERLAHENEDTEDVVVTMERPVLDRSRIIRVENVDGHLERVDAGAARTSSARTTQERTARRTTVARPRMDASRRNQ